MPKDAEKKWNAYAQRTLKREMGKFLVTNVLLAQKLNLNPEAIQKKIIRGSFSAGFFLQVLDVLGVKTIDISEIKRLEQNWDELQKRGKSL